MSTHNPFASLIFTTTLSLFLLPMFTNSHPCSEPFQLEAQKRKMNCVKKSLGADFGWNYDTRNRSLDILFGARIDSEMGWLAWGVNPGKEARMVGTRALIGIKQKNQTLIHNTYNVTYFTKIGCGLQPSKDIDLRIRRFEFYYNAQAELYVIEASIVLPIEYNFSRMNIVWQIGEATVGMYPMMHPHKLANLDCKETMDLTSGNAVGVHDYPRDKLRMIHGILNIVGWGTFLPIGVIIARYCRRHPVPCSWWYIFHVACQILGWVLGTIGFVLGLILGHASKYYCFHTHRILAIFIFTFATLQMFALRLKPTRIDDNRIHWNMYHHFLGYSLLAIISANIFQGIAIITTTDTLKWVYIGLLGLQGFTALLFESYTWIKFYSSQRSQQVNDEQRLHKEDKTEKSKIITANPDSSQSNESKETMLGSVSESQPDRVHSR